MLNLKHAEPFFYFIVQDLQTLVYWFDWRFMHYSIRCFWARMPSQPMVDKIYGFLGRVNPLTRLKLRPTIAASGKDLDWLHQDNTCPRRSVSPHLLWKPGEQLVVPMCSNWRKQANHIHLFLDRQNKEPGIRGGAFFHFRFTLFLRDWLVDLHGFKVVVIDRSACTGDLRIEAAHSMAQPVRKSHIYQDEKSLASELQRNVVG